MKFKLGKLPFVKDERDLMFRKYRVTMKENAPVIVPVEFGHEGIVPSWGMYLNDRIGICAIAGPLHLIKMRTAAAGSPSDFTDDEAVKAYSAVSGYDPNAVDSDGNNSTDTGCVLRDVLTYWRDVGFTDTTGKVHTIAAYVRIDVGDMAGINEAMYLFGGVLAGLQVPESMQQQFAAGLPLTVVDGSPIEGGHCMPPLGERAGGIPCSTWGAVTMASPDFFAKYYDEAWAVLSDDELRGDGTTNEGFDMAQLRADLDALP